MRRTRGLPGGRAGPGSTRRGSRRAVVVVFLVFFLSLEVSFSKVFPLSLSQNFKKNSKTRDASFFFLSLTWAWKGWASRLRPPGATPCCSSRDRSSACVSGVPSSDSLLSFF